MKTYNERREVARRWESEMATIEDFFLERYEQLEREHEFEGKLKPKDVKGGTILEDTMFTIHQ